MSGADPGVSPTGHVALVLHAHLPYVRAEEDGSLEERWVFEALAGCYLPLLDVLERLAREDVRVRLTLSVTPTLVEMLRDRSLLARFERHQDAFARFAEQEARQPGEPAARREAIEELLMRLAGARDVFARCGRDVPGALQSHARAGRIELLASAASHAFLPALLPLPGALRAQLRLGLRAHERAFERPARGFWLPECGFDEALDRQLAAAGVTHTVLAGHGVLLSRPRPPLGTSAPLISPAGVYYLARDDRASEEVWSRERGHPGDPLYRDFHRDAGFELPPERLPGQLGPFGARVTTGLKVHRVTGRSAEKELYDPRAAKARAREHGKGFVRRREEHVLSLAAAGVPHPLVVAPYDAELFGHFWYEGPNFLEEVLRGLDACARRGTVAAITLGEFVAQNPHAAIAMPAASSWGVGGHGAVWLDEAAALRRVHEVSRAVERAARARASLPRGDARDALEQAVREALLLQASDWPFLVRNRAAAPFARARLVEHATRARRLLGLVGRARLPPGERAWIADVRARTPFLAALRDEALLDAFDPW